MSIKIFHNTLTFLLVILVPNICTGCSDESKVSINSETYTCYNAIMKFGVDTICSHENLSRYCCATCAKSGNCEDESTLSINSEPYTCSSAFEVFGEETICKHESLGPMCCKSCAPHIKGCNDESTVMINSESITCPAALVKYGVDTICKHESLGAKCCESCVPILVGRCQDQKSLFINDKTYTCSNALYVYGIETICNHEDFSQLCCASCAPILAGECKDYTRLTINGQTHNCFSAFDMYGINTICEHEDLSPQCCASCKPVSIIGKKITAEGFFVVDRKSLEIFIREANNDEKKAREQLREDVTVIINDVNTYYDTLLQHGLDITLYIADIQILDFDVVTAKDIIEGDTIDKDIFFNTFQEWLQSSAAALPDTKYDFAMLLTGYNIQDPTTGYASFARMCQRGKATGVIEYIGLPDNTRTLAHEIGHVFGASHDPEGSKTLMGPSGGPDRTFDKFTFSDQSAYNISNYLNSAHASSGCLFTTSTSSQEPSVTLYSYTGDSTDPYTICERYKGVGSTPCLSPYFYHYGYNSEGVCRELFCRDPDPTVGCWPINPPEGLPCGPGKSCQKGKCMDDPRPELANVDPNCPLGEDVMPTDVPGVTCETLLMGNPGWYCQFYGEQCCDTCGKLETGLKDCKYGDVNVFKVGDTTYTDCKKVIQIYGETTTCQKNADLKSWCCKTCNDLYVY